MSDSSPRHDGSSSGFQQRLGLFDATMLVAGSMIGSGIFLVSADIARDVGTTGWLMTVWILTGLMTVIGAVSYAELAAMMPHAGGQYVYLRESYGPMSGFLYGWTAFLVIQPGSIAAVAVAFAKYLGVLIPSLGTDQILFQVRDLNIAVRATLPWMSEPLTFFERQEFSISSGQLVAVVVIVFLTWLNNLSVDHGRRVQNIFTIAKTIGIALLILLGLAFGADALIWNANWGQSWTEIFDTSRSQSVASLGFGKSGLTAAMVIGAAMVGSLFSADAWNNVTFTAGETKNPSRNIPLSLVFGTAIVIGLYLLVNVTYVAVLPTRPAALSQALTAADESLEQGNRLRQEHPEQAQQFLTAEQHAARVAELKSQASVTEAGIAYAKDDRVATAVLARVSPSLGVPFMAIAIMISTFGCVNGMILMGARLFFAMAKDGLFFRSCGVLNSNGVPTIGLLMQGIWAVLLVFSGTYGELLDYVIFACLLFYALTVAGLFVLRRTRPTAERPYRTWGYPIVPGLYIGLCLAVMLDLLIVKPIYTWPGLFIVAAGVPVYFFWQRRRTHAAN